MAKTSLYEAHLASAGKMIDFSGFDMPVRYTSLNEEHHRVRSQAGLFDASHMGEFMVKGEEATAMLQYLLVNNIEKMVDGRVIYSPMCNERGGVIDDLLVYRMGEEEYMLVVNASNTKKDWDHVTKVKEGFSKVDLQDRTRETSLMAIQGPESQGILQELTDLPLDSIRYYHFKEGVINGQDVILSRTGYTGEDGFEIYVKNQGALDIWNQLLEVGRGKVAPAGLGSRDTLRLEAAYPLYGNEFDDETSPLKAGLSWTIDLSKEFIGQKALKKEKDEGIAKKLVGLALLERGVPRSHYRVFVGDEALGEVTSGTFSPTLEKGIAMAYLPSSYQKEDGDLYVEIRKKKMRAELAPLPFVERRVKSQS